MYQLGDSVLTVVYGVDSIQKICRGARKIGRIAQLGERCPYKAEVTGSIPVPPTSEEKKDHTVAKRSLRLGTTGSTDRRRRLIDTTIFSCGAVVQLGLGRQIVNLEVAGSNPVGPAISPTTDNAKGLFTRVGGDAVT